MKFVFYVAFFLTVSSFGECQYRTYSPSVFENIQLGEAPNGVYIPQDSFLNALRNPGYRNNPSQSISSSSASNINQNPFESYTNNVPQQNFFMDYPSVSEGVRSQDTISLPDSNEKITDPSISEQKLRRRLVRRRKKIHNEPMGSPLTYSQSMFENFALGQVPDGVYVPPDSLLNALRNPYQAGGSFQYFPQATDASNSNFGLMESDRNNNQRQKFFGLSPTDQSQRQRNLILADNNLYNQYVSVGIDENRRNIDSSSRRPQGKTVLLNDQLLIRPPSIALDPSMEYPADKSREEMQALPRFNVEYVDFGEYMVPQSRDTARTSIRKQSRRKKKIEASPKYIEQDYAPKTYSQSVFQNIGLGVPPNGVYIPPDSLLNLLRDDPPQ